MSFQLERDRTSEPSVSVIIPAYNASGWVARAIESALAQTRPPLEVLVVDDGSTDDTIEVVKRFGSAVRLFEKANGGPASARNMAARHAHGDWLAMLDADDYWEPEKLAAQLKLVDDDVALIHVNYRPGSHREELVFADLWHRNTIQNSSVLIRRDVFEAVGGLDEDRSLIGVEDHNLWLRVAAAGYRIVACEGLLWRYLPTEQSLTQQTERFANAELANVAKIGTLLNLADADIQAKQFAVRTMYAREFFYDRDMSRARRMFAAALRQRFDYRLVGWWVATFVPVWGLKAIRNTRNAMRDFRKRAPVAVEPAT